MQPPWLLNKYFQLNLEVLSLLTCSCKLIYEHESTHYKFKKKRHIRRSQIFFTSSEIESFYKRVHRTSGTSLLFHYLFFILHRQHWTLRLIKTSMGTRCLSIMNIGNKNIVIIRLSMLQKTSCINITNILSFGERSERFKTLSSHENQCWCLWQCWTSKILSDQTFLSVE